MSALTEPATSALTAPTSSASVPAGFLVGQRVVVGGLNARPELNGRHAHVFDYDREKDRYAISVEEWSEVTTEAGGGDHKTMKETGERLLLRLSNLQLSPPPEPHSQQALCNVASAGFVNAARWYQAKQAKSGNSRPVQSVELKLTGGAIHKGIFVIDPTGSLAGTMSSVEPGSGGPSEVPADLRRFVQGRLVPDSSNLGLLASWGRADAMGWGARASELEQLRPVTGRKQGGSLGEGDSAYVWVALHAAIPAELELRVDRPDAPRHLLVKGRLNVGDGFRNCEVELLLSSCSKHGGGSGRDVLLWTSSAHARTDELPALTDSQAKHVGVVLLVGGLYRAVAERRADETWAIAVFIANHWSQRFWELTAIAHGILADLEEAIAGKTGLWAKLRHREEEARKGQPMKRGSPRTKASRPTVDLSGGAPAGQPPPAVECLTCGKVAPRAAMKVCSRCKSAYFCGAECQKAGWKRHKPACVARASPNAAVVEPRGRQTMVQSAVFDVG